MHSRQRSPEFTTRFLDMPSGFFIAPETNNIVCKECTAHEGNCADNDAHVIHQLTDKKVFSAALRARNRYIVENSTELKSAREQIAILTTEVDILKRRLEEPEPPRDRRYRKPYDSSMRRSSYSNSAHFVAKPTSSYRKVTTAAPGPSPEDRGGPRSSTMSSRETRTPSMGNGGAKVPQADPAVIAVEKTLPKWMNLLPDAFDPKKVTVTQLQFYVTHTTDAMHLQQCCILTYLWDTACDAIKHNKARTPAQQFLIDIAWEPEPFFIAFRQSYEKDWMPDHSRRDVKIHFVPTAPNIPTNWSLIKLAIWIAYGSSLPFLPRGIKFTDHHTLDLRNLAGFTAVHSRAPVETETKRYQNYSAAKLLYLFRACSIFAVSSKYSGLLQGFEIAIADTVRYHAFPYSNGQLITDHDIVTHFARDGVTVEAADHYQPYAMAFIFSLKRAPPPTLDTSEIHTVAVEVDVYLGRHGPRPGYPGNNSIRFGFDVTDAIRKRLPANGEDVIFSLDHHERVTNVDDLTIPMSQLTLADHDVTMTTGDGSPEETVNATGNTAIGTEDVSTAT